MSDETPNDSPSRVIPRQIADEMNEAFLSYSMSVIVQRALPDVRDGLKPVHRRILFAMHELGLAPGRGYKKSATVVGDVLGKYHPHGDSAVYDSMVRMAQDFSMRYPLVDGQGNFGSIDGDPAAAYRYTEARLTRVATEMLSDIDKDTVDFRPNYDDRLTEPTVLPSRAPNLLVNGSSGIAVGMATNIPPHNLREVVAACIHLIDHPDATALDLHTLIPGPDFPTGATIHGVNGIREAYETGRGRVVMRARATIEEVAGREKIVIHEIPYMVNKARLVENIAELVREKKIEGISDLRDESDRDGMRITIGIKRDAIGQIVLNSLYKHTSMQSTFGVIMLALVNDVPRVLNLREMIQCFVTHRHTIVVRRSEHDLGKARDREHILEGLKIAVDNIDEVVEIIRKSPTAEVAGDRLRERFELSEKQSDAILNMRLARLTGLEIEKLEEELTEVRAEITRLLEILGSLEVRMGIIKEELREVSEQYGDDRRTEIVPSLDEISIEDLIADEEMVITVSHEGYIKRLASDSYRAQHRGGRGVTGMETKDEDWVEQVFVASTHDYLMCFTREGHCHWIKVHEIPQPSRAARGRPIVNLMGVQPDTRLAALVPVRIFATDRYLVFVTRKGKVKRTRLSEFRHVRAIGIRAIGIEEGDELIDVRISDDSKDVLIATRNGQAIRFRETDARIMGRPAAGVRGIDLVEGDEVVGSVVARSDARVLVATRKGMGKRTLLEDYRLQRRGGSGVKNLNLTERTGDVVAVKVAEDGDELVIVTRKGIVNRQTVDSIRVIGRNTQGVKLIALGTDDDSGISDEVVDVEIMAGAPEVAATGVAAIDDGDIVADDGVDTALVDDVVDDEASVDE